MSQFLSPFTRLTLNFPKNYSVFAQFNRRFVSFSSNSSNESVFSSNEKVLPPRTFKKNRGTGDKGQSGLFTGERRWKNDAIFEALGSVDELSCQIGLLKEKIFTFGFFDFCEKLQEIQSCLQDLNSAIATPEKNATENQLKRVDFRFENVKKLDFWIDETAQNLPPLTKFILPGGGESAALANISRAVCRRAERRVSILVKQEEVPLIPMQYLNRLSDFLFVLGRFVCLKTGHEEVAYKKPK